MESYVRNALNSGLSVISVELSGKALEVLTASNTWIHSDAAFKTLINEHKDELSQTSVVHSLREVLTKRREEGVMTSPGGTQGRMVGLMSVREDRVFLFKI